MKVSAERGAAPLRVTFRATCASAKYRWRFGDGARAEGRTVRHTFLGGRFAPTLVTASGVTKLPAVTSVALTIAAPRKADYGATVTLSAKVKPRMPVRLEPDLVLTHAWQAAETSAVLRAQGIPVLALVSVQSYEDIRRTLVLLR